MFTTGASKKIKERNLDRAGAFDDLKKIRAIKSKYTTMAFFGFVLGFFLIYPIHIMLFGTGLGITERLLYVWDYISLGGQALWPGNAVGGGDWWRATLGWWAGAAIEGISNPGGANGISPLRTVVPLAVWGLMAAIPLMLISVKTEGLDPTPKIFGDTRWADESDIEKMSKKDLIGFDGNLFVVGKFKDKFIRMKETLSVLLLAPPGTGKTVAFIVPSTVLMDKSCILLNDQKPELFHMTSGHRANIGPVFQLMWSAQDMPKGGWMSPEQATLINPELLDRDSDGNPIRDEGGSYRVKPIYFPSWNPIGPASIPSAGPRRDLYIERLASVLAPDPNGGDKFWTSKARAAMIGLVHYLVAKVELGQDTDFPDITEDGIPEYWKGQEPSFPMLVDWFTEAQNAVDDEDGDDPMRGLFKNAVADAQKMNAAYIKSKGIPIMARAITELTALMNSPDKTRGSILSTLDEAMSPFKNEAVRQRTCTSSFSFKELRGTPKPAAKARELAKVANAKKEGRDYNPRYQADEWDPITIYISINAEDAKAFSTITGIFVDSANAYLVANGPKAIDDRGNQLGPHDFFFLLDETPTLPKLDTVMNGPAVGRSKRVSYAIVGQDFSQIETRYSKAEVETLKSTTAIKVILSQNNETAARSVSQMAGKMTYLKESYSFKEGDALEKFMGQKYKEIVSGENWEGRDFIDVSFVMAMPQDKHIVLVQNFMNRPILADTPKFFLVPDLAKKVFNLRNGSGPKPAFPMPRDLMDKAAGVLEMAQQQKETAEALQAAIANPIVTIVATPQNISDITRDLADNQTKRNRVQPQGTFAIYKVKLTDDDEFFPMPKDTEIVTVSDAAALAQQIAGGKVYLFDGDDQATVESMVAQAGATALAKDLFVTIKATALEIDREEEGDIFTIGYYGTAGLDPPIEAGDVTPAFALRWLCEMVTVTHSIDYERKRMQLGRS
jgi:type IV secretion system protein VirD4